MNQAIDIVVLILSTVRLTRLVTTDDLGTWATEPLRRWAWKGDRDEHKPVYVAPKGWRTKLVGGLDCPFCVGYWIGAANLALMAAAGAPSVLPWVATSWEPLPLSAWRIVMGTLALNYLVGHLSARLDASHEESE